MMMIGIGLVGYEESRPLKAAIGKLPRCRDDGFAVTLARRRDPLILAGANADGTNRSAPRSPQLCMG